MADRTFDRPSIEGTWRALAGRLATLAGCSAALVALWNHVPADVAALRGAGAWALIVVLSKLGLAVLCRAIELEQKQASREEPR